MPGAYHQLGTRAGEPVLYEIALISSSSPPSSLLSRASLREAVALPTPEDCAGLVLALLCTLHLRRMSRRRRILASLQAGIAAVLVGPVLAPNLGPQHALVACTRRRGCIRADDRVGADRGVGRGGAVEAV